MRQFLSIALAMVGATVISTSCLAQNRSCAPQGTTWSAEAFNLAADQGYKDALKLWQQRIPGRRELEGASDADCKAAMHDVAGYEGFPVLQCNYKSDGGDEKKAWPALPGIARTLNPSVDQLAAWTVTACRDNGHSAGEQLKSCLSKIVKGIWGANNAQFPLAGVVIERRCDVSGQECNGTPKLDPLRQPLLMTFRDGVTVASPVLNGGTPGSALSDDDYTKLFTEAASGLKAKKRARVANATREAWSSWRSFKGLPEIPAGWLESGATLAATGWLSISREVHKAACKSERNEVISAAVRAGIL